AAHRARPALARLRNRGGARCGGRGGRSVCGGRATLRKVPVAAGSRARGGGTPEGRRSRVGARDRGTRTHLGNPDEAVVGPASGTGPALEAPPSEGRAGGGCPRSRVA